MHQAQKQASVGGQKEKVLRESLIEDWKRISVDFQFVIEIVTPVPINDYIISYTTDRFLATWKN